MMEVVLPDGVEPPAIPVSHGVLATGRMLFVSGQGPLDLATSKLVGGDFEQQATLTFENLATVLNAGGARLSDVVKVSVFLANIDDFPRLNEVYARFFRAPFPTRTTVQAGLGQLLIEVDAIAVLKEAGGSND